MKKFLCFFGIFALIAGFVTSCGDDDDDDDGNGTPGGKTVSQKKLKEMNPGSMFMTRMEDAHLIRIFIKINLTKILITSMMEIRL